MSRLLSKANCNHSFLVAFCMVSFLSACHTGDEQTLINGQLDHAATVKIVFSKVTENGDVALDSTTTDAKGNFTLHNKADAMDYYLIRTSPTEVVYLILDGSENITLKGDANALEKSYSVSGSVESESLHDLRKYERRLTDSLNTLFAKSREVDPYHADSVGHHLEKHYYGVMGDYCRNMVKSHLTCLSSLSATKFLDQSKDLGLMTQLADSLKQKFPDNRYVTDYLSLVADLKKLPPGSPAPPIELRSADGKPFSLASLRGKIVLIDFWASWCGPCRRANPALRSLYAKYKGAEFELLGVSLDENSNDWKEAIQSDGLTWPQVSELKKWDSRCIKDYNIEAIPFSVLVDKEGKIIAKGLQPEDLDLRIQEALRKNS